MAGPRARHFCRHAVLAELPGRSQVRPGEKLKLLLLFGFCFLGLLRGLGLLCFLRHSVLYCWMNGNATGGLLGGGPASHQPQTSSEQIRGVVVAVSRPCHGVIHSCRGFSGDKCATVRRNRASRGPRVVSARLRFRNRRHRRCETIWNSFAHLRPSGRTRRSSIHNHAANS
jgi:hypothetical protein